MCLPDDKLLVPIPDLLWAAGSIYEFDPEHPEYGIDEQGRKCLRLDRCIVPAIEALWAAGIPTRSCCCGHGSDWGSISLAPVEGIPGTTYSVGEEERIRIVREERERLADRMGATDEAQHIALLTLAVAGAQAQRELELGLREPRLRR